MVDSAAPVLFLRSEKQLSLLPEMQDMGGIAKRSIDIVGDHDDSDACLLIDTGDLRIQAPGRDRIETRHGLVQQDELLRCAHGPRQQDALLLPPGQVPIALVLQVQDLKRLHVLSGAFFFRTGIKRAQPHPVQTPGEHHLPHTGGKILLNLCLLRQVPDLGCPESLSHFHSPRGRLFQSQQSFDEGAFPGSVLPDNAQIVSFFNREIQVLDHCDPVIGKAKIFTFQ